MHRSPLVRAVALALPIVLAAVAFAQRTPLSNRMRGMVFQGPPVSGTGEVVAMRPGLLQVKAAGDQMWLMKIEAPPEKIELHGTAVPGWLRPRMSVRFSVTLDKTGKAQAPVDELFVFTPTAMDRIGVFPDSGQQFGEPAQPPPKGRKRRGTMTEGRYLVAGTLAGVRDGTIRVVAAGQTVTAQLAENAKIRVDLLGDYSLVRQGDKVEYAGRMVDQGKTLVDELKFTAASPFGGQAAESAPDESSRANRGRRTTPRDSSGGRAGNAEAAKESPRSGASVADDDPAVGAQPAQKPR